jgi:hypothetical protein
MAALRRLEQALARVEAAAARAPASGDGPATGSGHAGDEALRRAHFALRARVEGAIAQIDRMLETEDGR